MPIFIKEKMKSVMFKGFYIMYSELVHNFIWIWSIFSDVYVYSHVYSVKNETKNVLLGSIFNSRFQFELSCLLSYICNMHYWWEFQNKLIKNTTLKSKTVKLTHYFSFNFEIHSVRILVCKANGNVWSYF